MTRQDCCGECARLNLLIPDKSIKILLRRDYYDPHRGTVLGGILLLSPCVFPGERKERDRCWGENMSYGLCRLFRVPSCSQFGRAMFQDKAHLASTEVTLLLGVGGGGFDSTGKRAHRCVRRPNTVAVRLYFGRKLFQAVGIRVGYQ